MGVELDVNIIGDAGLIRLFRQLDDRLQTRVANAAARKTMRPIRHAIRGAVPYRSGRLAGNIMMYTMSPRKSKGLIGSRVVLPTRYALEIKHDGYYPTAMEYGYRHNGWVPDEQGGLRFVRSKVGQKMPGRPFMRKTWARHAQPALPVFVQRLREGIEREAKKAMTGG